MSLVFPAHVTAVETSGVAVLRTTWSDKLCQRLAGMDSARPNFRVVREAYEGLPMRVAQDVAGEQVFSRARTGVPRGWYRTRTDTVAAGAPNTFIPGVCIAGPVGGGPGSLSVIPGSARLPADTAVPTELAVSVDLDAGDVAVLDSRCMRRWSAPETTFQLSVVRPWIEPEQDAAPLVDPQGPARASRFAGLPWMPAPTLESWLFDRHERRS